LSAKSASASELRAGNLPQLNRHRRRKRLAQWRLARRQKRPRMRKTRERSAPSVTGHTRHRVDTSSRVVAATPRTLAVASHTAKGTSASRRAGARRHARQVQGLRLTAPAHLLGQARWPRRWVCARGCASDARPGRSRSRCAWTAVPAQVLCNRWGGPAGGWADPKRLQTKSWQLKQLYVGTLRTSQERNAPHALHTNAIA
jgi:hypothetical protein